MNEFALQCSHRDKKDLGLRRLCFENSVKFHQISHNRTLALGFGLQKKWLIDGAVVNHCKIRIPFHIETVSVINRYF